MSVGEVNNSNSNYELMKRKNIENTPFTIITIENNEHFITLGKYRLSEKYETFEEAEQNANTIDWNKIMQIIGIMIEKFNP